MAASVKLFAVYADYRGPDYAQYPYYVRAESKKQAKAIFTEHISWLKVYRVEPAPEGMALDPYKHILIGG